MAQNIKSAYGSYLKQRSSELDGYINLLNPILGIFDIIGSGTTLLGMFNYAFIGKNFKSFIKLFR